MSMDRRLRADLDNYITGHYGEDQLRGEAPDGPAVHKFNAAIQTFYSAAIELQNIWDQIDHTGDWGTEDYPFDEAFEEVAAKIGKWLLTQRKSGG